MLFETISISPGQYKPPKRRQVFFELVFVLSGQGLHRMNQHHFSYKPDKLFMIAPKEHHVFMAHTATAFYFIRFNQRFVQEHHKEFSQRLAFIYHHYTHLPLSILQHPADKSLVRELINAMIREKEHPSYYQQAVIQQLLNSLLIIIARNIHYVPPSTEPSGISTAVELLNYIHFNIHYPDKLKARKMAQYFNFSTYYIGEYFRSQVGQTLQQYKQNYRMRLVASRLLYTKMQINEIVHEFGYTDASHLNRSFKAHTGMSPSLFRKVGKMTI